MNKHIIKKSLQKLFITSTFFTNKSHNIINSKLTIKLHLTIILPMGNQNFMCYYNIKKLQTTWKKIKMNRNKDHIVKKLETIFMSHSIPKYSSNFNSQISFTWFFLLHLHLRSPFCDHKKGEKDEWINLYKDVQNVRSSFLLHKPFGNNFITKLFWDRSKGRLF